MKVKTRMEPALIIQKSLESCAQTEALSPTWMVHPDIRHISDCLLKIPAETHDAAWGGGSDPYMQCRQRS